jgi:precorrin-2 dehydrogenase/sirohydrochlorin ferrochelatase
MEIEKAKPLIYYPAFINIQNKKCVVVGGGEVALRRVKMLLRCGGRITVVSPAIHPELVSLAEDRTIALIKREYEPQDIQGATIVIAATDAKEMNRKVAMEARKPGTSVNVVDDPEQSDFIVPSFIQRGALTIAVSTSGKSPALARKMKTKLEMDVGEEYGLLVSLVDEVRTELKRQGRSFTPETWQKALDLDLLADLLRGGYREKAKAVLQERLETFR